MTITGHKNSQLCVNGKKKRIDQVHTNKIVLYYHLCHIFSYQARHHLLIWLFLLHFKNLPNFSILNIFQQEDVSVQLEALDILADLLSRFGGLLISFHPMLLNSLLPQLASPRQVIKKNYSIWYQIITMKY